MTLTWQWLLGGAAAVLVLALALAGWARRSLEDLLRVRRLKRRFANFRAPGQGPG